jgi:hypothetical protein
MSSKYCRTKLTRHARLLRPSAQSANSTSFPMLMQYGSFFLRAGHVWPIILVVLRGSKKSINKCRCVTVHQSHVESTRLKWRLRMEVLWRSFSMEVSNIYDVIWQASARQDPAADRFKQEVTYLAVSIARSCSVDDSQASWASLFSMQIIVWLQSIASQRQSMTLTI